MNNQFIPIYHTNISPRAEFLYKKKDIEKDGRKSKANLGINIDLASDLVCVAWSIIG